MASPAVPQTTPVRGTLAPDVRPGATAPAARALLATAAAITVEGTTTRFRMALSDTVSVNAFVLPDPYRVVVDMPETRFDVGAAGRATAGLIRSWRYGLFATGRSRLVFDTAGPTRIVSATVEPAGEGRPACLVIDLAATTPEAFAREQAPRVDQTASTGPIGKSNRDTPHTEPPHPKPVIVLDPGHGGLDAGTVSPHTGTPEKQVVLEFSRLLAKRLTDSGRYEVVMTRTTDTFVPLGDRVKFARAHHADLFVSIHADAELDRSVRGSTVFTLAEKASEPQAAALAAKENQSDALAGIVGDEKIDEVADILIDLTLRETRQFSHVLARDLVEDLSKSGHMVKQNPHRSASLKVLRAHDIPSVLIELGFLSNKDDEAQLMAADWRARTAAAIEASVNRFFAAREARAVP